MNITLFSVPAIIVGLIEVLKKLGLQDKYIPLLDVLLGVGLTWLIEPTEIRLMVLWGIVLGLSAGGLYDLGKEPVKTVISKLTK
jgi:hypothetical protein